MIEVNQLNRLLKQLMGKLDTIIEQNEKIIQQNEERERNPGYPYPYIPPVTPYVPPANPIKPDKYPWTGERPYTTNIICNSCGGDSGIPQVLSMVITPPGLSCCRCGAIVVTPNTIYCDAQKDVNTNAIQIPPPTYVSGTSSSEFGEFSPQV